MSANFLQSQLILVCIPADWNESLVLYVHGFLPSQAFVEAIRLAATGWLLITGGFQMTTGWMLSLRSLAANWRYLELF